MFHLAGFYGSQAGNASLATLNALAEQVLNVQNNAFLPDKQYSILGAFVMGANLSRAQFSIPSYRDIALPDLHPLQVASAVPTRPNWIDLRNTPFIVRTAEPLAMLTSNSAGTADAQYGAVLLTPTGLDPVPAGRYVQVRFTATITATANAWTLGQLSPSQNLPPGTYTVIGGQFQSATAVLARLVFPGQVARPGILGTTSVGNIGILNEMPGALGAWGRFNTVVYPQLEIVCTAADTAQTVTLDCIYQPAQVNLGP
ncbi:MAG: hypothetical protein KGL39_57440 [Patescibacteria group bacterium]|nr:hypothetical protein [Patescibacteria group bacterium]